jgi:hypothetical protein
MGSRASRARLAAASLAVLLILPLAGGAKARFGGALPRNAFTRAPAVGGGLFVRWSAGDVTRMWRIDARGSAPAWSPDGRRLAYVAPGPGGGTDVFVADADAKHRARLTRTRESEVAATWSPDGRRLLVERGGRLILIGADGRGERALTAGTDADWSLRNRRIVFVARRGGNADLFVIEPNGHGLRRLTTTAASESDPVWSPDGRSIAFLAEDAGSTDLYVLDFRTLAVGRLTQDTYLESSPQWSKSFGGVTYLSDRPDGGPLWSVSVDGGASTSWQGPPMTQIRWQPAVSPELRPDMDQRTPSDLTIQTSGDRYLLGFTSASDNIGLGPISITASRPSTAVPTMRAAQRVRISGGGARTYPEIGLLRFVIAFPHEHWHLMDFQRYELRRATDHALVVRDRKSGFCLADHWGHILGYLPGKPSRPVFTSNCANHEPGALAVSEGTSVGYTDRYPAFFHGQNLDITHVQVGTYVLVHRTNPTLTLRELRYENNASSVLIRLSRPGGRPAVKVLRVCPSSEWCAG